MQQSGQEMSECEHTAQRLEEVALVETLAVDVVNLLQQFIDRVREVLTTNKKLSGDVAFYDFQSSSFVGQVLGVCQRVRNAIPSPTGKTNLLHNSKKNHELISDNQRYMLVHRIIHPLLEALTRCYHVLDKIDGDTTTTTKEDRSSSTKRPKPPPGLLSLRNYTDIAATLELLVTISLLPLIDFTFPRKVSQSLSKRLPLLALQQQQQQQQQNIWTDNSTNTEKEQREQELFDTFTILYNVLQLDRFRPMLFPRHALDLFAASLQLEHWNIPETVSLHLDPVLEASACQTLLSSSTRRQQRQCPMWLRQRLSAILQHLAETNLMAIFQVFLMGEETSAAALRLARTLLATVEPDKLCQSLLGILDSHGDQQQQIIVWHTIWAILDGLPETVQQSILQTEQQSIPITINRLRILFPLSSTPPPFVQTDTVLRLVLANNSNHNCTAMSLTPLSLVLRVSSLSTIFPSSLKQSCQDIIRGLVQYFEQKEDSLMLAMAITLSVAPSSWDWQYKLCLAQREDSSPEAIEISEMAYVKLEDVVQTIVDPVVKTILKCLVQRNEKDHTFETSFFQVLLWFLVHEHPTQYENVSLVSMVALPMLVEHVEPERLIGENVLDLVLLVLDDSWEASTLEAALKKLSLLILQPSLDLHLPRNGELIHSMKSLLLSVLVSILELGSPQRNDEEKLQILRPVLVSLAQADEDSSVSAEFKEMASHAAALIASRGQGVDEHNHNQRLDTMEEIREEMTSEHPALRARAIVTLRHKFEDAIQSHDENMLRSLLKLALIGLRDSESYVYLAAIHTIAAAGDQAPSLMLPLTSQILVSGEFDGDPLSLDQRAKLCEALVFIIRRRGGIYEYMDSILGLMLYGSSKMDDESMMKTTDANTIQSETHQYFAQGYNDDVEESTTDKEELWAEQDLRLRTGGPIFSIEESDVVRAGMVGVVSELVMNASPSMLAPFGQMLTLCAVNTLRLDGARQVRRAGALLAREMYAALRREEYELMDSMNKRNNDRCMLLSQAMSPWEEKLAVTIERCATGQDLADLERIRWYDAATVARCEEALSLRVELHQSGFLALARAGYESNSEMKRNPVARMLQEEKQDQKPSRKILIEELSDEIGQQ